MTTATEHCYVGIGPSILGVEPIIVGTRTRFDVEHARDAAQPGVSDEAQLHYAAERGHAILTHNRVDFELLASKWFDSAELHPGIIIAGRRPIHELARLTLVLLSAASADSLLNQIRYT